MQIITFIHLVRVYRTNSKMCHQLSRKQTYNHVNYHIMMIMKIIRVYLFLFFKKIGNTPISWKCHTSGYQIANIFDLSLLKAG
jgi:hypothetical protein